MKNREAIYLFYCLLNSRIREYLSLQKPNGKINCKIKNRDRRKIYTSRGISVNPKLDKSSFLLRLLLSGKEALFCSCSMLGFVSISAVILPTLTELSISKYRKQMQDSIRNPSRWELNNIKFHCFKSIFRILHHYELNHSRRYFKSVFLQQAYFDASIIPFNNKLLKTN